MFYSQMKSDSSSSFINPPVMPSMNRGSSGQPYSSYTSDRSYVPAHLFSAGGPLGSTGNRSIYNMIYQQDEDELLNFARKMFTFFSMQKIFLGVFITFVYNNVPFTEYVKSNFFIFAISAFILMTVLFMVHIALDFVRKPPQSYICYLMFMLSESWVVAFILASTDGSTAFLFTCTVTAMVLGISLFLNTQTLNWIRGVVTLVLMACLMFLISVLTLNYTDLVTILVCMTGGLMFGVFLLSKAFALL
jgi:hypothetical protein